MVVVIFGVAGVGKTTVGKLIAEDSGWKFLDADDLHPAANIEKMRSGVPLTDDDRKPWLERVRQLIERCLATNENAVLACSALKRKYRKKLQAGPEVKFVFLRADRERVTKQLKNRRGHYFGPSLLDAQFADLEEPDATEDVVTVDLHGEPRDVANEIASILRLHSE
jgi:gluconokinase